MAEDFRVKSMEQLVAAADGALVLKVDESAAPPLRVEMPDGRTLDYQLVTPTAETILATRRRYGALSDEEAAFDPKTWSDLLATFMRKEDAVRFVREQTFPTVHRALRILTERAVKELARVG